MPAATSVVSWTAQPGANLPSAVPTRAGESPPEASPVTGVPGSFGVRTGLSAFFFPPPSADCSVADRSSALPSLPVPLVTGVYEVYVVSARSEMLGDGHSRLVRSTGSTAAARAVSVAGGVRCGEHGEAGDGGERGGADDQGQGGAVHC